MKTIIVGSLVLATFLGSCAATAAIYDTVATNRNKRTKLEQSSEEVGAKMGALEIENKKRTEEENVMRLVHARIHYINMVLFPQALDKLEAKKNYLNLISANDSIKEDWHIEYTRLNNDMQFLENNRDNFPALIKACNNVRNVIFTKEYRFLQVENRFIHEACGYLLDR